MDLNLLEIKAKYKDKLLFDYPLKQFRQDKYSKEIQVLQADLSPFDRALQAIILNQYRRKIFESHYKNIKPVILFKSKTITESDNFYNEFHTKLKNLTSVSILKIANNIQNSDTTRKIFEYFKQHNITLENLASELKEDFCEAKSLVINSKNDSDDKQLIVNSLEDYQNEYRAIFAVDKLNEGWDVLNLFDIVRLEQTNYSTATNIKTTMAEAQLIGRGARYCPFQVNSEQDLYKRKYDNDLENDLRICEELYYHAAYNPKYIAELSAALVKTGIKSARENKVSLFNNDDRATRKSYQNKNIFLNQIQLANLNTRTELEQEIRETLVIKKFITGYRNESHLYDLKVGYCEENEVNILKINTFGVQILRKAINKMPFYRFDSLQKHFPNLTSIDEFLTDAKYFKNVKVQVEGTKNQVEKPSNNLKLEAAIAVLDEFSKLIAKNSLNYANL